MSELTSLPASLQAQIGQAERLLASSAEAEQAGDRDMAIMRAEQGMAILQEVAARSPELGALLVASQFGYKGIEIEDFEQNTDYREVQRKFLGLTLAVDWVPFTTTNRHIRKLRLF